VFPCLPKREKPSWIQTTSVSCLPQKSSHTVPHSSFKHISTLPVELEPRFVSLTSPDVQTIADNTQWSCKCRTLHHSFGKNLPILLHETLASSLCPQLCCVVCLQFTSLWTQIQSTPHHPSLWCQSLLQNEPSDMPQNLNGKTTISTGLQSAYTSKAYTEFCNSLRAEKPNCRHTTLASALSQLSSHTVPHALFLQTSTRPLMSSELPLSLIYPFEQTATKYIPQRNSMKLFIYPKLFCPSL